MPFGIMSRCFQREMSQKMSIVYFALSIKRREIFAITPIINIFDNIIIYQEKDLRRTDVTYNIFSYKQLALLQTSNHILFFYKWLDFFPEYKCDILLDKREEKYKMHTNIKFFAFFLFLDINSVANIFLFKCRMFGK